MDPRPLQQEGEVLRSSTRLRCQRVWLCRSFQDLCLILLVSLFLLLLVSHTCTGAYTDTKQTDGIQNPLIKVGIIMPHSMFRKRAFQNKIRTAIRPFDKDLGNKYEFSYNSFIQVMMSRSPSAENIDFMQDTICNTFVPENVSAIIYPTMDLAFGNNIASSQYFLDLAGNLGIPIIAWNADNSGLEQSVTPGLRIQMAPSIHHQAAAMLAILIRYEWHAFTIVTSMIAGHTDFLQTIRDQVKQYGDPNDSSKPNIKFTIIDNILVTKSYEELQKINGSEGRILLYSTQDEAFSIMRKAQELKLTGKNFVWIVTQSVIGDNPGYASNDFPLGVLGVHFETSEEAHMRAIVATIRVFAYGVKTFLMDPKNEHMSLQPELSCEGNATNPWPIGTTFYKVLKDLNIPYDQIYDLPRKLGHINPLEFLSDGTRKDVELKIMNLRKSRVLHKNLWEEIGTWSSLEPDKVFMNDIVWPGDQHIPPGWLYVPLKANTVCINKGCAVLNEFIYVILCCITWIALG